MLKSCAGGFRQFVIEGTLWYRYQIGAMTSRVRGLMSVRMLQVKKKTQKPSLILPLLLGPEGRPVFVGSGCQAKVPRTLDLDSFFDIVIDWGRRDPTVRRLPVLEPQTRLGRVPLTCVNHFVQSSFGCGIEPATHTRLRDFLRYQLRYAPNRKTKRISSTCLSCKSHATVQKKVEIATRTVAYVMTMISIVSKCLAVHDYSRSDT